MDLHLILKFLHVATAVVWLGGGSTLLLLGLMLLRRNDHEGLMSVVGNLALAGPRLFMPASVLTLMTGVSLVLTGGLGWSAWVVLALAGIAFSALFGALVLGPAAERAVAIAARVGTRVAQADGRRMLRLAKFDHVVQFAIVWLMVARPGWDQPEMLVALAVAVMVGAAVFLLPTRRLTLNV